MFSKYLTRLTYFSILIAVAALLAGIPACGDDPAGTGQPADLTGKGEVDPNGDRDFLLGSAPLEGTIDGLVEVWVHDLTLEGDSVVAFSTVLANRSSASLHPPVRFLITELIPAAVQVLNPDFIGREGPAGFDFSDDLGDDNRLDPGESSAAVRMRFRVPGPISFAIGFQITADVRAPEADLSGVVFFDGNRDGHFDPALEKGLPGFTVLAETTSDDSAATTVGWVTITDAEGRYGFAGLEAGVYRVAAYSTNRSALEPTTPNPLLVTLVEDAAGNVLPFHDANFGFYGPEPPDSLRRVFGPIDVGPASLNGTELDTVFVHEPTNREHHWVLEVVPPPIMGPFVLQVTHAHFAVNGEVVWSFDCPPDSMPMWCVPGGHFPIPAHVFQIGENAVEIVTEGDQHTFISYSILRD